MDKWDLLTRNPSYVENQKVDPPRIEKELDFLDLNPHLSFLKEFDCSTPKDVVWNILKRINLVKDFQEKSKEPENLPIILNEEELTTQNIKDYLDSCNPDIVNFFEQNINEDRYKSQDWSKLIPNSKKIDEIVNILENLDEY